MKQKPPAFYIWGICVAMLLFFNSAIGQIQVSGTITDAELNEPLIGVNVIHKGTLEGTVSDFDGTYSINVPDENAVLEISYIGYSTQEIIVGTQRVIDIALSTSASVLDEVVVVGYTTRKKGELTGSVSTVKAEDIERTSNKDVAKSLSGKVPGLIVADRGGYPGSTDDLTLLIRGKSTLNNNSPLILIDGITAGSFSHLSPQDIESLTVLKDGAAAIYGARAANGVILITTKRGRTGKPVISLSSSYSQSRFSASPKLMSSEQFAIYENEIAERNGTPIPFTEEDIANYAAGDDPVNYPSTDWFDLTFADYQPEFRTSLSISGGAERVNYFVSGDYFNQVGLFESGDTKFKQYQLRSNIDIKLFENFKLGVDVSGRFGDRKQPGVEESYIYKHIYVNSPTEVGIYPNGLPAWGGEDGSNPYVMSSDEGGYNNQISNNLRSKLSYDWNLGGLTKGLSLKGFAGIRRWTTDTKDWYTPWTIYQYIESSDEYVEKTGNSQQGTKSILRESFWKYDELMLNSTLHYDRTFSAHTLKGFVGYEQFSSESRNFYAERKDFPSDNHPELFAGSDEGQISSGTSTEWGRLNYFGALSYDFQKKYFIDLTLRHDGSSNFGPGKRFGTFPGIAVAWSIGNESFMERTSGVIDALKLRASWALMGNDRIASFQYLTRYSYGGDANAARPNYYTFGMPGIRYNGYTSANVPNPDITWETADMKNIGLNFALLDYRLTGDINYFFQKREDILITRNASIPQAAGITLPQENLGEVNNFGMEFQLGWTDKIGKLGYNIGANLTQAKNEVVYLDEAEDTPEQMKREGFSMDSYIVYPTAGIFRDQDHVDATEVIRPGTVPGEPIYIDTNEDGVIDSKDRVRVYSSNVPEIQYGVSGGLNYQGFDFNFLFQGQAKAEMIVFFDQGGAKPEYVFNERWTPDNPDSRYPRAFVQGDPISGNQNTSENFQGADLWLHDASYLRLKEVELGYSLSDEKLKFGSLRVFVRGLNLLTMFSEVYDLGLDPEASRYNNFRDSTYPSLKSVSFGLSLKL